MTGDNKAICDTREVSEHMIEDKDFSASMGYLFHTQNNVYFYDAGTGRVIQLENEEEKQLFQVLFGKVVAKEMKRAVEIGLREGKYDSILSEVNKLNFWRNGQAIELYSVPHANIETYLCSHIEQLILELTERCNLRCRYCIYNTSCDLNRDFGNNDMTREVALTAIDFAFAHSQEKLSVTFYGGEPLLMFPLMKECISYSLKKANDFKKQISFSFTTNLTLLSKDYALYFASVPHLSILCSIDGPQDIHDAWRQFPDGSGSFTKAMEGFHQLRKAFKDKNKTGISVNGVFAPPYTRKRLEKIAMFYDSLDLPEGANCESSYPSTGSVDDSEEIKKYKEGQGNLNENGEFIHPFAARQKHLIREQKGIPSERLNRYNLVKSLHAIHDRPLLFKANVEKIPFNGCCPPGSRRLYVTTQGEFKVCERIGKSPNIGNIVDGFDLGAIKKHYIEDYNKLSIKDCKSCVVNLLCGICYAACFNEHGLDIHKKRIVCKAERLRIKENLRVYYEMLEECPEQINKLNSLVNN